MSFVNFKNVKFFSRKCNSHTLIYDEACLDIASDREVTIWRQYTKCVECDYAKVLDSNKTGSLLVETIWPVKYKVEDSYGPVCNGTFNFGEYGRYQLNVTKNGCSNITVTEQPDEPLFPMLVAVVTMLSIATLWYLVKGAYKKISQWEIWNRLMRTLVFIVLRMKNHLTHLFVNTWLFRVYIILYVDKTLWLGTLTFTCVRLLLASRGLSCWSVLLTMERSVVWAPVSVPLMSSEVSLLRWWFSSTMEAVDIPYCITRLGMVLR